MSVQTETLRVLLRNSIGIQHSLEARVEELLRDLRAANRGELSVQNMELRQEVKDLKFEVVRLKKELSEMFVVRKRTATLAGATAGFERRFITIALERNDWDTIVVSRALDIPEWFLLERMKKHQLDRVESKEESQVDEDDFAT